MHQARICSLTASRLINAAFPRLTLEKELEEISLPREYNPVIVFFDSKREVET